MAMPLPWQARIPSLSRVTANRLITPPVTDASSRAGFVRGLAAGVIVGGIIVLIFTPRTGEEIREWVGETAQVLAERVIGTLTGEASYVAPDAVSCPITSEV